MTVRTVSHSNGDLVFEDADGDGLCNLEEYVFGGVPVLADGNAGTAANAIPTIQLFIVRREQGRGGELATLLEPE